MEEAARLEGRRLSTQAWDVLVRRLERRAQAEPRSYRLRVAALAALGYAVIGGTLLAVLAAAAGAGWLALSHPGAVKLLIPLALLAWVIARALPVRLEPPWGLPLGRADAPELLGEIERLRAEAGAPRLHRVVVDGDLNAAVCQIPRLGPFGPTRNVLLLGLPLLQALSPDELRAVLAHELGHVSGRHGRFGARVYRIRETWTRLLARLEADGHVAAVPLRRFFRWYAPYFGAYTFVLAREHEYAADRAAADAAGPAAAAAALARIDVLARHLGEEYWPGVYGAVEHERAPAGRPFSALARAVREGPAGDARERYAGDALAEITGTADTHPCLRDRLAALGVAEEEALRAATRPPSPTAAERFLGPVAGALADELDERWRQDVAEHWEAAHHEARAARARLAELDASPPAGVDGLFEHAELVRRFEGGDAAIARYRAVLAVDPSHAQASYALGHALLGRGADAGLEHLEVAMGSDPDAILPGCELAAEYLQRRGRQAEAAAYRARAAERGDALEQAWEERRELRPGEELADHDLPQPVVAALAEQLAAHRLVQRAYLARRVFSSLSDELPSYLLAVDLRLTRFRPYVRDPRPAAIERLAGELDVPFAFFVVDLKQAGRLGKRIRRLGESRVR